MKPTCTLRGCEREGRERLWKRLFRGGLALLCSMDLLVWLLSGKPPSDFMIVWIYLLAITYLVEQALPRRLPGPGSTAMSPNSQRPLPEGGCKVLGCGKPAMVSLVGMPFCQLHFDVIRAQGGKR